MFLCFSIREVAQSHHSLEQELAHAVNASSKAMDVVYANSKSSGVLNTIVVSVVLPVSQQSISCVFYPLLFHMSFPGCYCHILVAAVLSWALLSYLIHCCTFLFAAFLSSSWLSISGLSRPFFLMPSFPNGSFVFLLFAILTINVDYVECESPLKFLMIFRVIFKM